ncbi:931_t:CDS:1 [Paraglomus brasilianum]|uniref:931_t:CDS:1 n=1 Tax=Paraglomus brasilianum TaxID=144538 RepID=A0A9N9B7A5_9GLOM|nr:931_t:CDS:1 [Paraglomus brasilianum]
MSTEAQAMPDPSLIFGMNLIKTLNNGALCLMISIGHRTGLFDTLATFYPEYVSSQTLAEKANLNERYVREWLGGMVVGEIIEYDSELKSYRLPQEHALLLTRAAVGKNMAILSEWVSSLACFEDGVLECFRNGGGLHNETFYRIHEIIAERTELIAPELHSTILPCIPGLLDSLEKGCKALDIGCGRGFVILDFAKRFPNSTFYGYDILPKLVADANADVASSGLTNVSFRVQDVSKIEEVNEYDVIICMESIHVLVDPINALKCVHRALKENGVFALLQVNASSELENNKTLAFGPALYSISAIHTLSVSLAEGGMGLGACWGNESTLKTLKDVGFNKTDVIQLPNELLPRWFVSRKQN